MKIYLEKIQGLIKEVMTMEEIATVKVVELKCTKQE
jgi:hypothetical protein